MQERCSVVLYVDDNGNDAALVQTALQSASARAEFRNVTSAKKAIDYLRAAQAGPASSSLMPDLVILELWLPDASGLEVLQWIRRQPRLHHLPVLIYTDWLLPATHAGLKACGATDTFLKRVNDADLARSLGERFHASSQSSLELCADHAP